MIYIYIYTETIASTIGAGLDRPPSRCWLGNVESITRAGREGICLIIRRVIPSSKNRH